MLRETVLSLLKAVAGILINLMLTSCVSQLPILHTIDITHTDFRKEMKQSESCEDYFLLFFGPVGSMSIHEAASKGNIKSVKWVRYTREDYFLYSSTCVNVFGL